MGSRRREIAEFERSEPSSGLRPAVREGAISDGALALLLENIDLLLDVARRRPPSSELRGLIARAARCRATVNSWWREAPSSARVAAIRSEVLAIANALGEKRSQRVASDPTPLYDATIFVLTGAGEPMASEAVRIEVSRYDQPIDALGWQLFVDKEPTLALLGDRRLAMVPRDLPGGASAMHAAQDDVIRLLAKRPTLTLLEIAVLLRYEGRPSASWDPAFLRSVIRLDGRARVTGQTVTRV